MAQITLTRFEQLLTSLELHIEAIEDVSDGKVLLVESHQHGGSPLASTVVLHCDDTNELDSDALMHALYDAGIFTNKQLDDAWTNFGLPVPPWL